MLCFILNLRAISQYKRLGACIWECDLSESFLRYECGGLIFGGAYFRNFTVSDFVCYNEAALKLKTSVAILQCIYNSVFLHIVNRNEFVVFSA